MKKIAFVLLVLFLLLMPACEKATPASLEAQATQPQPAASQPVEITFMAWGDLAEQATWQQIADEFHAANPNIIVKIDVSDWDSYWSKLDTLFNAQTPPDVFAMDAPMYLDWQSRGVLLNLQPYLDATPGFLDELFKSPLKGYQLPDGYYGLPYAFQAIVMFYNKDMFAKAGLPYPTKDWTWDDLRAMAKQLTVDENADGIPEQYGFSCDLGDMDLCASEAIWAYGGEIVNADFTRTLIAEPPARQAWQLFHDMIFVDKSMPDAITANELGHDLFQSGVAAMVPMGHRAMPGYAGVDFQWDVTVMPAGPAGRATSITSTGFVVSRDSKYPHQSWEFIKFVLSQAGQKRLTQLGFAIPVNKMIAESPYFMDQKVGGQTIYQEAFLESLGFARMKPVFKGYSLWRDAIENGMALIWSGEAELGPTLDQVVIAADKILAEQK